MGRFRDAYIAPLPKPPGDTKVGQRVRIAVLDSGLLQNTDDMFLQQPRVMERIIRRRNFFSPNDTDPDPEDWKDKHGHGTQVARLLLRYAPRADIIIAKICDSKSLKITKKAGLLVSITDIIVGAD
jgi:hypothetical protein